MSALQRVRSIKTKLGLLVLVSVLVTALVASVGSAGGVPWWLGLPVTVGLALVVTQLLAAGMVAPLREMTTAATAMSQGRYGVRVLTDNTDEVGELARAFNRMAEDLAQVDTERRDLIATVSHELRTPITAMSAQLENLVDGVVEVTHERLGLVLRSAEQLGELVTDLLALSRLEAGVVELERSAVPLRALVLECAAEVRRSGRDADMDVRVAEGLVVRADAPRLRLLLVNVLDNAARHAPEGTPVVIHADSMSQGEAGQGAAGWWLEVLDAGPGVEPDERERVFERFGTDSAGGGTGLGLAIARWVASLHGGRLAFRDPDEGSGARLRLEVPPAGELPRAAQAPAVVSAVTVPPTRRTEFWPEERPEADVRPVLAALAVGVVGGVMLTFDRLGLAWACVLLLAGGVAWAASTRRTSPFTLATSALAVGLVASVARTENAGLTLLAIVVAAGVFLSGITGARTFRGMLMSGMVWPAAGVRGLGWLGRSLGVARPLAHSSTVLRPVLLSVAGLLVFGMLFASADATFARWVGWLGSLVPRVELDETVARAFVAVGIFGLTVAAAYVARNPARVDPFIPPVRPATSRWEWLAPLLVVDVVFAVFVASQVRVVLGGHDYVRRTSGLSYAEYVHQGFGQLVVATLLTLVVVWGASRRAGTTGTDRRWFLLGAGALCFLTFGVVAAALGRMAVYQDAYGFTTLRVFVNVFEGWLGFVVLMLAVLGAWGRGRYVARVALLSGSAALLALVLALPDAWVAHRNIDRFEESGKLDVQYLASLSEDAAPVVLERLPREVAGCVLERSEWSGATDFSTAGADRSAREWTWSHARAAEAVRAFHAASSGEVLPCQEPGDH